MRAKSNDRYKLWPYTKKEDGSWTVTDAEMIGVWAQMVQEGRAKVVFYPPGSPTNEWEWLEWVKSPQNHPVLVVDMEKEKIVFIAFLNSCVDRICFAHFCGLGVGTYRPEIGKLVMSYWSSFLSGNGEPIFHAIFAMVPEINEKAIRLAKGVGFKFLGTVPGICELKYEGRRVGGTFGYYIPEQER